MHGFKITSNQQDLDIELIHGFISNSYWAKGIPKATLQKAISNSLVFGVYTDGTDDAASEQVGFARLISDKTTFAYLADVFILETYRGKGLSRFLMETIIQHPDLQGLRRFMLATKDAHELYAKYGFVAVENPEMLMQIWQPNIYTR